LSARAEQRPGFALTDSREARAAAAPSPRPTPPRSGAIALIGVGAPLALGVVHALVVARRYHVGSFDDDANYILAARALLAGHGLTGHLTSGVRVVGVYPPGYPLLLVPLVWAFGHGTVALRALSLACDAALFPLTWHYLGRRRISDGCRVATLGLLAMSPVLATFGTMVMAETPFLVVLLSLLLLLERWERSDRTLSAAGAGVIVATGGLVLMKEAAAAMAVGVVIWLLWRRALPKAIAVGAGTALLLAPVVIARLATGVPLAGARYTQELGGYYPTSLTTRLHHVVTAAAHYATTALPASILPTGAPLPGNDLGADLIHLLACHVSILCAIGAIEWARRHRDAAIVIIPLYLAETLVWPLINERRVILVLPIVVAWYALGARVLGGWILAIARRHRWASPLVWRGAFGGLAAVALLLPLTVQFPRDYLFGLWQDSSQPAGSRYIHTLAALGAPSDVVETDYPSTVALDSGHRTANTAFVASYAFCSLAATQIGLTQDRAAFVLLGALNKPFQIDSPCLLDQLSAQPWAVRIMRTSRDLASVFELIGPGTAHPELVDVAASAALSASSDLQRFPVDPSGPGEQPGSLAATATAGGSGTLTWDWSTRTALHQVSVGEAGVDPGLVTEGVRVQLRSPTGAWTTVASAASSVGDLPGATPLLLVTFPEPEIATAMRVVIDGAGTASALDVHALATRSTP